MSGKRTTCLFVSDLHGSVERYGKLFGAVLRDRPGAVFLGGDLLPHLGMSWKSGSVSDGDFVEDFLKSECRRLRNALGRDYPEIFLILGNDDLRTMEPAMIDGEREGVWLYAHERKFEIGEYSIYGYACVPPTPFRLKDWERYDVSRFVDPGAVSPQEGWRSVPVRKSEVKYGTIQGDLQRLAGDDDLGKAVFMFHTPPYKTLLDRAALDGRSVAHVPLDVYVGSIAVRRFIESRQPLLTLHGHVHESARLTGSWRDRIGRTIALSAAHDGPELALVRFDLHNPAGAARDLI